ncbi:MAG: type II secretion system F family protein, partial [Planctomycetaceae bacterium]|nr:type II secretion system F family protein [Planctomycetaceae bacterium]
MWGLWSIFNKKSSRATERLDEWRDPFARQKRESGAGGGSGGGGSSVGAMFNKAAPALSKALESKNELEQSNLKIRLANAGFSRQEAPRNFLAIKVISLGVGLFIGGSYGFYVSGFARDSWMSLVIGGGIGFFIPEIALTFLKWGRQEKIFLQLPDALDLLVVCVEAGLGLDSAMRRVSEELANGAPEVCSELATANMQMQMGKARREVLHDLGIRTGVDDVRALAAILIQADR